MMVSFPDCIFLHPGVWSTAYSIIHLSALEWWCTDLKLGMIKDCIPHCVTLIECLCKVLTNFAAQHYLCTWSWYCACFTIQQWWVQQCWSSCHLQASLLWSLMEHYVMKRGKPPPLVSTVGSLLSLNLKSSVHQTSQIVMFCCEK